ncbi:MAG: TIR domain-containing protein [Chlorobiaceae bacterium]|nr:TIR domain-containing protein [Chlorobiaceae bacterium]
MATSTFQYDVFLSHNSKDKPRVRALAERLRSAGLRVWFDEWLIKPGDDIYLSIERGLETARVQVLCLSPEALGSEWVALERSTVLFRDPTNAGRRFVPLLLADCDLPDTLRRYKYVDFREELDDAFDELLEACRREDTVEMLDPKKEALREKIMLLHQPESDDPMAILECTLTGHKSWVNSIAISSDGTWAVSGDGIPNGSMFEIRIWDLGSGKCRWGMENHNALVSSVAITPDGSRILSASFDTSVRVLDAFSAQEVAKLEGHTAEIWSVVALHDNAHIISGGWDKTLRVWDLNSGKCLRTIECGVRKEDEIFGCAVNPAGTQALSGHRDGHIRIWNIQTGECISKIKGHSDIVKAIQVTQNGEVAISCSSDRTIKVWNLETGSCIGKMEGHGDDVTSIAISPNGKMIASTGGIDHTVRLWDIKSGACLNVLVPRGSWPECVAFSSDGSRFMVGTAEGPVLVYRFIRECVVPTLEPTRRYVNAKVVLLGEGTVGKTSLAHRLIEDKYVVKDRTHGMNVWPLPLPLPPDASIEREALLWDLAGQEDYRLIHRLFLDETALALLLINPQKDDPFAEAGDWLKALDTAADNHESKRAAEKLLLFSQIDVGGMKVGNAKIDRFIQEHGFKAWLETSAKSGENCSDEACGGNPSKLKQLIAESIPWDKLPWTATPRLLAELKSALLKMRDTADIRLMRFAELAQRLEQALPGETFGESEVRTAVTLLANHGLARALKFGDLVLLQPELLNGYAGAIIRAARAHKDEIGCVLEVGIYDPAFDFTGVDRLPRPDEELLLRVMVQTFLDHSLCIAEETPQGRQLVFPSQYRREKDIPWQPDVFVSYTFNGEWQTIWTTLVVRLWYGNEFAHKELWRNAAEFASSRGHLLGLKIDNRQGEGEATISLFFDVATPDDLKVIFIEYVHRHLARYGCNVTRDRRYVCACGKPVSDLTEVQKRLAAGKEFIYCQGCDEKVPLIDFIEQHLKSDPVARKIMAMEEKATRELDNQALEQILIGHMMATCGEANQVFRPTSMFDYGIDGEVEFRDDNGQPSGTKIYVQLKSGNSYLRKRRSDGREIFDVKNDRHLDYWLNQPVDVWLVIRQTDERTSEETIRWMNVTSYLKNRSDKSSRQIVFDGEPLTMKAVWQLRDQFFPRNVGVFLR